MTSDNRPNEPGSSYPGGGYPGGGSPLFPGETPTPPPAAAPYPSYPGAAPAAPQPPRAPTPAPVSSYPGALAPGQVVPPPPPTPPIPPPPAPRPAPPPPPPPAPYPSYPGAQPAAPAAPRPAPAPYPSHPGPAPIPAAPPPPPPPPHIEAAGEDSFTPRSTPGWSSASGNSYRNGSSTPVRIGGTRRNPSAPSSSGSGSSSSSGMESVWGNVGFAIGVSVVSCIPALILGVVIGGAIHSSIPGMVLGILLSLGIFYLTRGLPRMALMVPVSVTAFYFLGFLLTSSNKPDPKQIAIAKNEGRRYDAILQGKAVGQCKDQWERGVTAVGVKDIFRQSWWDAATPAAVNQARLDFERMSSNVEICLEAPPANLSKRQATLAFDPYLGLYPIQMSDIHTTIALATKAFELGMKKGAAQATPDELYQLSIKVRQLDSIGRDPSSTPNTRIGKIPGTGLGM